MKAAVIGATGYGGIELIRLLSNHPEFTLHSVYSSSKDQVPATDDYPHLHEICPLPLMKIDPEKITTECDVVFLAVPSGASSFLSPQLLANNTKVVDLSGDLRLKNTEDYKKWYKKEPAEASTLEQAVYGLTEWNREEVKNASLLSNPGCYPTATLLGLAPAIQAEAIDPSSIIIDAKSGVSGAGRGLSQLVHFAEMNDNFRIYKVNQHQHIPEIEQQLQAWDSTVGPITFSTHLLPITRGIMATIYAPMKQPMSAVELHQLYKEAYKDSFFVRVRPLGEFPGVKEVAGSNFCDIGIDVDERTNRATIVAVIDNLMKGAAGQAIQNANIMFGIEETAGLRGFPIYP
ncbi:N-acetyl-gamma-glutamyl-phosphate reductase [Bacillus thermotolerans]|uniref:N-acetyl-gamma-glutamyl-phosphate reductase n=1 Tax=Bacillus thermotolerans TaxID=1221996 RepID=A0A0F5HVK0_BACTR|nr:N-acetyl-gamma-glutamyl-phosphate reductase [Bacillus thermotolerans]KKB36979.1 N-acetyl-gamma-glutamyl-phosphate reductase [Bacillus thermotolerans]KKB37060.1 N-acetyl-gamma-glutamyl-phosphate reductase [Bacillus thermotolerans]KKB40020.1 N-acetyl-gamma-glutamyl-phosphate reductase [Bacillus thermotolerans]